MAEYRCSFCGEEYSEVDNKGRLLLVADEANICDLCVLQAVKQIVQFKAAEREYLSWGNDGTEA